MLLSQRGKSQAKLHFGRVVIRRFGSLDQPLGELGVAGVVSVESFEGSDRRGVLAVGLQRAAIGRDGRIALVQVLVVQTRERRGERRDHRRLEAVPRQHTVERLGEACVQARLRRCNTDCFERLGVGGLRVERDCEHLERPLRIRQAHGQQPCRAAGEVGALGRILLGLGQDLKRLDLTAMGAPPVEQRLEGAGDLRPGVAGGEQRMKPVDRVLGVRHVRQRGQEQRRGRLRLAQVLGQKLRPARVKRRARLLRPGPLGAANEDLLQLRPVFEAPVQIVEARERRRDGVLAPDLEQLVVRLGRARRIVELAIEQITELAEGRRLLVVIGGPCKLAFEHVDERVGIVAFAQERLQPVAQPGGVRVQLERAFEGTRSLLGAMQTIGVDPAGFDPELGASFAGLPTRRGDERFGQRIKPIDLAGERRQLLLRVLRVRIELKDLPMRIEGGFRPDFVRDVSHLVQQVESTEQVGTVLDQDSQHVEKLGAMTGVRVQGA